MRSVLSNIQLRTLVIVLAYVLLYFMYSDNDVVEKKARAFGFLINANQYVLVTMQALLSLTWHHEAKNKAHKALFLSFSIFCLLRILYRSCVLLFDGYLVSSSPVYFMMLFIVGVLVIIERRWA